MALVLSTLEAEFLKIMDRSDPGFVGDPATPAAAAANWRAAYETYALSAADASGEAPAVTNGAGFEAQIASLSNSDNAASAAAKFAAGFLLFWTGAVFTVGVPPTPASLCPSIGGNTLWSLEASSVVSVATNVGILAALIPAFTALTTDPAAKAAEMANIFHTATTTEVIVLITGLDTTPPPAGPLPITNTCTIV